MARSDPGSGGCTRQRPRSATTGTSTSSSPRARDQPSARNGSSSSATVNGRPTPKSSRARHSLRSFDLAFTQHLRPAFVLSPLDPTSAEARTLSSIPNPMSARGAGEGDLSENERPRRTVSSPQLVVPRSHGRARSDSASSSASLTATEENYARAARRYHGHEQGTASHGTSTARFPTTTPYPALWTFAAQPLPVPMPVSPTSPDSSDAAVTSPSDDTTSDEDSEYVGEGRDEDEMIFVSSRASSSTSMSSHMRNRRGNGHGHSGYAHGAAHGQGQVFGRVVTTARGQLCAGETETELDEMPIRLPTTRNVDSRLVVPLLIDILVPFLFQVTRFLSIVPATVGTVYNCYLALHPPPSLENGVKISSIDYIVCVLWAILTGFQCLFLTTGLLSRWKAYYTAPSTLIRLVALQGICWPATHFTLMWFDHKRRPLACWALIGTTTCLSRSVQLWVTSNLYMPVSRHSRGRGEGEWSAFSVMLANLAGLATGGKVLREEGKLGPRRWDWAEVMVKCALPAGVLYFLTAWALILKEELEGKVL